MSLFRVDPDNPFSGPHQNQPVVTGGVSMDDANIGMILIHGRGASAQSMMLFAEEFTRDDIHYRAIQASRHTWYPRSFLAPKEMNQPGISSGLQFIHEEITQINNAGIPTNKIMLLGFSQGACLTTEFAARHPQYYGGIVGFSGGLIGEEVKSQNYSGSLKQTPVFLGCSDRDPHIPQERVDRTEQIFSQLEADVTKKIYKEMGHTVNENEIKFVNGMLNNM
ncbi:phospholipase/carboxylesterase [Fodinibius salinus]|uniref:Phospholipase/carboxylesterase n=1 Tax=Fodinibius salinus TaxID=860790 RepID=A0A5D3YIL3_9BACT|nr:dienelactone hydrolase family protein [Fodinibius salinus]TYP93412.1 phospholipase/carboxylesterase [Fodinibius salinus]